MLEQQRPYCECAEITAAQRRVKKITRTWDSLDNDTKISVRKQLSAAQGGFCVYCERPLTKNDDQIPRGHVEHIKPRSKYPDLTFDHTNLAASCNGSGNGPVSCGHKKADHELPIEPGPGCHDRLVMLDDGTLDPGDNADLAQTLENLGLNAPQQVAFRKSLVRNAAELLDGGLTVDDVSRVLAEVGAQNYLRIHLDDLPRS